MGRLANVARRGARGTCLRGALGLALSSAMVIGGGVVMTAQPAGADGGGSRVEIHDDCQAASFNAVIGAGTCVGDGETSFGAFIGELTQTRSVAAWHFDPTAISLGSGESLEVRADKTGEFHTFTRVEQFGGGFVDPLNHLSGNPIPVPETKNPPGPSSLFLHPDARGVIPASALKVGVNRFQCLIHPWMRTVVTVAAGT